MQHLSTIVYIILDTARTTPEAVKATPDRDLWEHGAVATRDMAEQYWGELLTKPAWRNWRLKEVRLHHPVYFEPMNPEWEHSEGVLLARTGVVPYLDGDVCDVK